MARKYTEEELQEMNVMQLEKLLTPRERDFCERYLASRNGTEAATQAGYSKGSRDGAAVAASRLLRRDKIGAYLRARAREIYGQLHISPETVAADLIRLYRRATQAEPVMAWDPESREMVPTGEWTFDGKTAVKVLELLGDSFGMFEKGQKLDAKIVVEMLGDAEELGK